MGLRRDLVALAFWATGFGLAACGTDAMGSDACRKIEQARCRKAPACPALMLQTGTGVDECVQFARDQCLHGLAVADPGVTVVDKCVGAIEQSTTCDALEAPETLPACAFLQPTPAPDAGPDADGEAADATVTDADADLNDGG
jgi:hypothetical protein